MSKTFGTRLKELRLEKGYSQTEIADHLNISRQSVSRWENDISYPDIDNIKLLSDYYEMSIDELIKETKQLQVEINEKTELMNQNIEKIEHNQKELKNLTLQGIDEGWILLAFTVISISISPFGLISIPLILWRNKKENLFYKLIIFFSILIFIYNIYVLILGITSSLDIGTTVTVE